MEDYFTFNNVYEWQSRGECIKKCVALKAPLAAMSGGNECYCSDTMPNTKVDRKKCNKTCNGYEFELCGSLDSSYMTVHKTGAGRAKSAPKEKETSTKTSATQTETEVPKTSAAVVIVTPSAEPEDEKKKEGGLSKGAAAGVAIVCIAVVAGLAIAGFILYRRRKRQQVEQEYHRKMTAQEFAKPQMDHRLEPVMLKRRLSDGSIADNEDYSRRILKVTNPDG